MARASAGWYVHCTPGPDAGDTRVNQTDTAPTLCVCCVTGETDNIQQVNAPESQQVGATKRNQVEQGAGWGLCGATQEPRPALSESASRAEAWVMRRALGGENRRCKGPEVRMNELGLCKERTLSRDALSP